MPSTVLQAMIILISRVVNSSELNEFFKPPSESRNLEQSQNSEVCLPRSLIRDYDFPNKINYVLLILSSISNMLLKMFPRWISAEDDSHFLLNHAFYTEEHNDIISTFYFTILCLIILASTHNSDTFFSSNSHTYLLA